MICCRSIRRFLVGRIQLEVYGRQYQSGPKAGITSQEMSAALRPFYFAVHPDLFWQHPNEKVVNENSLKHLNSYLESLQRSVRPPPTTLTFHVRFTGENEPPGPFKELQSVNMTLDSHDLHTTIRKILVNCKLSTEFLDKLRPDNDGHSSPVEGTSQDAASQAFSIFWNRKHASPIETAARKIREAEEVNLGDWLLRNVHRAQDLTAACEATRQEVDRMSQTLIEVLELQDILWNCGWGVSQFRGCLYSFYGLAQHYPVEMEALRGRTLVFGSQTGVSLDGHIILSSGDVKDWWIDLLRSIPKYDSFLAQLPSSEHELSEVLRGIQIDHRKFQPTVMVHKYISQLGKLSAAIYKYRWQKGLPDSWPRRLDKYQLVVECEAGPLMLSPTGQFIVPASCPAFLLISFISENLSLAKDRMQQYKREKLEESEEHDRCISRLALSSLQKDDNVTPARMIECCRRLADQANLWGHHLQGTHLRVANFYSVLQDGEVCIPWNWQDNDPVHAFWRERRAPL